MGELLIGTCGYGRYRPPGEWKKRYRSKMHAYAAAFPVLELNRTFYRLPRVETAARWRREVAEGFEFTVKAWQGITHPTGSPTWRGRKQRLSPQQLENLGLLRPNDQVVDAWDRTREVARALGARICLLQTPARFDCGGENRRNMDRFFERIDRGGLQVAWEPRGEWSGRPELVREMCRLHGLIHVVDLMRREPVCDNPIAYVRLHGLNEREYDYAYRYSAGELRDLAGRLKQLASCRERVYCMFNNTAMYENASALMDLV
ncbi:MAG: DUF72 domain-containing protein [Spirochaetota bacterium]